MISKLTDRELLEKIYQMQIIILGRLSRMDEQEHQTLDIVDFNEIITDINSEVDNLSELL